MKPRYRKISVRIWGDEKFRELSDRGKLAFLFCLTHPNLTGIGAMRATMAGLAAEIGWSEKAFREAFREPLAKGMARVDERACAVTLPRFIKHNPPESPNVVKSWKNIPDSLPECALIDDQIGACASFILNEMEDDKKGFAKAFREAFPKALPKDYREGLANQEHMHKQEQKHTPPKPPKGGESVAFAQFWQAYPRRVGKGQALKAWERIPDAHDLLPRMLAVIAAWSQSEGWTKDGGRFIPHPATWLNGKRWEDDPPEMDLEPPEEEPAFYEMSEEEEERIRSEISARNRAELAAIRAERERAA